MSRALIWGEYSPNCPMSRALILGEYSPNCPMSRALIWGEYSPAVTVCKGVVECEHKPHNSYLLIYRFVFGYPPEHLCALQLNHEFYLDYHCVCVCVCVCV